MGRFSPTSYRNDATPKETALLPVDTRSTALERVAKRTQNSLIPVLVTGIRPCEILRVKELSISVDLSQWQLRRPKPLAGLVQYRRAETRNHAALPLWPEIGELLFPAIRLQHRRTDHHRLDPE
jgi:hypothetical protein